MTSWHKINLQVFTQQRYQHEKFSLLPTLSFHLKGERIIMASGLDVSFSFLAVFPYETTFKLLLKGNLLKGRLGVQIYSLNP